MFGSSCECANPFRDNANRLETLLVSSLHFLSGKAKCFIVPFGKGFFLCQWSMCCRLSLCIETDYFIAQDLPVGQYNARKSYITVCIGHC